MNPASGGDSQRCARARPIERTRPAASSSTSARWTVRWLAPRASARAEVDQAAPSARSTVLVIGYGNLADARLEEAVRSLRAAVEAAGLAVEFQPSVYRAEGLIAEAGQSAWRGTRVLFPRAAEGRDVIPDEMRRIGLRPLGDPADEGTDVGPVIDEDARRILAEHAARMDKEAKLIKEVKLPEAAAHGCFFAPRAYELSSLSQLTREVFGPVLHVVRYEAAQLDEVLAQINATGYGLTLGIHSRIDSTVEKIARTVKVGNCYVNRNQIGAVVGVQPFGGEGLSGTGPKAGGPHYLMRFATERTLTVNTAAIGGVAGGAVVGIVRHSSVDHLGCRCRWILTIARIARYREPPHRPSHGGLHRPWLRTRTDATRADPDESHDEKHHPDGDEQEEGFENGFHDQPRFFT